MPFWIEICLTDCYSYLINKSQENKFHNQPNLNSEQCAFGKTSNGERIMKNPEVENEILYLKVEDI
jgi:hypothetical protein